MTAKLAIRLKRSTIGRVPQHKKTIKALGLRKLHQIVVHEDTPQIRGMINSVQFMVDVKQIEG